MKRLPADLQTLYAELLDQLVGFPGIAAAKDGAGVVDDADLVLFRVTTEWAADGGSSANTQYQRKVELELVRGRAEQ